ncbi:21963_t:CDS:1, partial [Racocetra persica]
MGHSQSKFFNQFLFKRNNRKVTKRSENSECNNSECNDCNDKRVEQQINMNKEPSTSTISVIDVHRFIEGRRFRISMNATYTFPSDYKEATRFNESIKLMKRLFNYNYSAPVEQLLINGAKVLEIG